MHYKHWTREQAIDYIKTTVGMPEIETTAEVERYLIDPSQALAYKVGMLDILRLRAQAQKELGDKFDLKKFHDAVLLGGSLPLVILDKRVAEYIKEASGK